MATEGQFYSVCPSSRPQRYRSKDIDSPLQEQKGTTVFLALSALTYRVSDVAYDYTAAVRRSSTAESHEYKIPKPNKNTGRIKHS